MDDLQNEIIKEFLIECSEHLDSLDNGFIVLEKDTKDTAVLTEIFRSIHTIKGGAGMLAFNKLESLTHSAENLLSLLRDGKLVFNSDMVTALLKTVDAVRQMLTRISQTNEDGDEKYQSLINTLNKLQSVEKTENLEKKPLKKPLKKAVKKIAKKAPQERNNKEACSSHVKTDEEPTKLSEESEIIAPVVADTSIRINVDLLDKLMNLVGELVLSRNQILQFISMYTDTSFVTATQRLNLITSELQEGIMTTRMQQIGTVWGKFPRIIRDLATACKKKVHLEMIGMETELDKTLIEAIKDPLTHIVRNSVDHGIESPEDRLAKGKPEEGTLTLNAYHEGGHVNIDISDDGGGISADKIKAKALEKELITFEQAERMSKSDALNLIFMPGLSTADKVTNVSGRGVGMDVVRTNIERINGTIDIDSKVGCSTTLKIKIPLTLAIIPAIIITSDEKFYAIPQVNLLELVRLEGEQIKQDIFIIKEMPIYKLRGKLLPLMYLNKELGLSPQPAESDVLNIVVLQAGDIQFGLVVDRINDTQEIVVKPLSKLLNGLMAYAGATIMGDGTISLILDVVGLARKAGLMATTSQLQQLENEGKRQAEEGEKQSLLLLRSGEDNIMAIPLEKVDRIEEFPLSSIECAGSQEVVQYRDSIMPVVRLTQFINNEKQICDTKSKFHVVVYSKDDRNFGLIVDHVSDIVEGYFSMHQSIRRPGVAGSAVVNEHVTEILDVEKIIATVLPNYFEQTAN